MTKTIDITPTWEAMLPVLLTVAIEGATGESRATAREELRRMARLADWAVEQHKAQRRADDMTEGKESK